MNKKKKLIESVKAHSLLLKFIVLLLILLLLAVIVISHIIINNHHSNIFKEPNSKNTVDSIISNETEDVSKYISKEFDFDNSLSINNLFLIYENNITIIKFNLCNNSDDVKNVFSFYFSLVDENGNILIDYNLSSKKPLEGKSQEEFVLIATRDVSNAYDYTISANE